MRILIFPHARTRSAPRSRNLCDPIALFFTPQPQKPGFWLFYRFVINASLFFSGSLPGAAIGGAGRCRRVGRTIRSHGNPAKEPLKVARRPRGENDAALESGCVAAPATLGGDKPREAVEGVGAPRSSQHGHGVMPVLRSGGVGAERAADGPLAVGESRAADFSGKWLSAFVVAGAAEPILSKRLQGRKANVVNVASSIAAESAPLWASGAAGRK